MQSLLGHITRQVKYLLGDLQKENSTPVFSLPLPLQIAHLMNYRFETWRKTLISVHNPNIEMGALGFHNPWLKLWLDLGIDLVHCGLDIWRVREHENFKFEHGKTFGG
jgi:hypothetical protein